MFARAFSRVSARALSTSAATAARRSPNALVGASAVAAGVAAGVLGYKSECLKVELDDATAKKLMAALSKGSKGSSGPRYNTLMPSPPGATIKCCVVEVRALALSPKHKLKSARKSWPPRKFGEPYSHNATLCVPLRVPAVQRARRQERWHRQGPQRPPH